MEIVNWKRGLDGMLSCKLKHNSAVHTDGRDILIWYKDNKGADKSFNFTGSFKGLPNNSFVKDVVNAYAFNTQTGAGDNMREAATNPALTVQIVQTDGFSKHLTGTIFWNPNLGSLSEETGVARSPATVAEHEFDHAVSYVTDPKAHGDRAASKRDDGYGNDECARHCFVRACSLNTAEKKRR